MKLTWHKVYGKSPKHTHAIGEEAATPFGCIAIRVYSRPASYECTDIEPYNNPYLITMNNMVIGRVSTIDLAKIHAQDWYDNTIKQLSCTSNT